MRSLGVWLWLVAGAVGIGCSGSGCPGRRAAETEAGAKEAPVAVAVAVAGGTFTIRLPQEPAMLNPLHDQGRDSWGTRVVMGTVYETLAELDPASEPSYRLKPRLAERWEVSADRLTTTVHLRPDVRFHDDAPFTSADVKAVLDVVMNPALQTAAARSAFEDLDRWETPDARAVVLHWKRPSYYGFRSFVSTLPMLPRGALQGEWGTLPVHRAPVGTGPFRFERWETGTAIHLVRVDGYWGGKVNLEKLQFRIVRDATLASQLWREGAFELMTSIPPTLWRALETKDPQNAWASKGYRRIRFDENNYGWIGWNQKRPWFGDVRVRRALGHLYPAEKVAQGIELGLERGTTCPYLLGSAACDPEVKPLSYDPARARALLDESGWKDTDGDGVREKDGQPFAFTFLVTAHSEKLTKLVPLLQEAYAQAGIRLEPERVEWAVFLERLRKGHFDAASLLWSTRDVEQDLFATFHSTQTGAYNYVSYRNPEVDALLVEARVEFDDARREALLRRVHRLLYEDQVYTFLTTRPSLDAAKVEVQGLTPSLTWYDFRPVGLRPSAPESR